MSIVITNTGTFRVRIPAQVLFRVSVVGITGFATDSDAIHKSVASEITSIAEKASPTTGDFLIIEDGADSNNKKKVDVNNLPSVGGGESNTASNVGTGGIGTFKQKTGVNLEFRNIDSGSSKISVTLDTPNNEVVIDVVQGNLVITASQVSDFSAAVASNSAVTLNTAKNTYPAADASKLSGIEPGADVTDAINVAAAGAALLAVAQSFTKAQRGTPVTVTSTAASVAFDFAAGNNFKHILTEDTTFANPTNVVDGQSGRIEVEQDAGTARTIAFGSNWKFNGGSAPVISTTLASQNAFVYEVIGTEVWLSLPFVEVG